MFNDANFSHRSDFSSQTFPRYGFFFQCTSLMRRSDFKIQFSPRKGESSKSCRGWIRAVRIKLVSDFFFLSWLNRFSVSVFETWTLLFWLKTFSEDVGRVWLQSCDQVVNRQKLYFELFLICLCPIQLLSQSW